MSIYPLAVQRCPRCDDGPLSLFLVDNPAPRRDARAMGWHPQSWWAWAYIRAALRSPGSLGSTWTGCPHLCVAVRRGAVPRLHSWLQDARAALAARIAAVPIGSSWTNVLGRSPVDPPVQR